MRTLLTTSDLTIGYARGRRSVPVVSAVNVNLQPGEMTAVIGPNGAGKSTLLRTVTGQQSPLGGVALFQSRAVSAMTKMERARTIASITTNRPPVSQLLVRHVVGVGRYPHTGLMGRLDPHDHAAIEWSLDVAGASGLADRHIGELSDGETQRVMLARGLAQEPRLLVLDEPTAFLDVGAKLDLVGLLRRLAEETDIAVLMSTHDLELVLAHVDAVWLVTDGQVLVGSVEDLALSGALAAAFTTRDGARFDPNSMRFVTHPPSRGTVRLDPTTSDADWVRHALARSGYTVTDNASTTITSPTPSTWALAGDSNRYRSINELLRALRHSDRLKEPQPYSHSASELPSGTSPMRDSRRLSTEVRR